MSVEHKVMVSVAITAYNHAPYIEKAIQGVVEQKVDFPIELIIHDDASTDGTADIIQEYARRYPELIIAILQTENQYSQGHTPYEFISPHVHGKYWAVCEGDDYWCDPYKLQKQIDYMEEHQDCTYCFSNAYDVDASGNILRERIITESSRVFSPEEIVEGFEDFPPTASVVTRRKDAAEFPAELAAGEVGDEPFRDYLVTKGYAYCFADKTCCYRVLTPHSWTSRFKEDLGFSIRQDRAVFRFYKVFDEYSNHRFADILHRRFVKHDIPSCMRSVNLKKLRSNYRDYYSSLPLKEKLLLSIKYYIPIVSILIRCIRYGIAGGLEGYRYQHSFYKDILGKGPITPYQ